MGSGVRKWGAGLLLGALLFVSGCATPGAVLTEDLAGLRSGVAATREQARLSIEAANKIAREQAIEYKLDRAEVSIADADFPLAVARADAEAWNAAFGVLDSYAATLQKLVDPERAAATGGALAALGQELNSGVVQASIPPSVAGAVAAFGSALVQARAERTATEVMREVDPAFQAVVQAMVAGIGGDDRSGLRQTVRGNWAAALSRLRVAYAEKAAGDRAGRRALLLQYVGAMDARDAQLANLEQLRAALLALGEAHGEIAAGRPVAAQVWIDRAHGLLDDVRKRIAAAEKEAS